MLEGPVRSRRTIAAPYSPNRCGAANNEIGSPLRLLCSRSVCPDDPGGGFVAGDVDVGLVVSLRAAPDTAARTVDREYLPARCGLVFDGAG